MNKRTLDRIHELRRTIFATHEYSNYAHAITISGLMILKPTIFETKGKKVIGFILFQINRNGYESYRCQSFSKSIINTLTQQKNVVLVNCLGRFVYTGKDYLIQIEEIVISAEYPYMELLPEYEKGA